MTTEKSMICVQSKSAGVDTQGFVSDCLSVTSANDAPKFRATYPFSCFQVDAQQVSKILVRHPRHCWRETCASLDTGQRHAHQHGIYEQMENASKHGTCVACCESDRVIW